MNKRKAISKKLRFEVFKRDNFECQYCGNTPPEHILHVDHIDPVKNGGSNDIDNLVTSCQSCNLGKGATLLSAIPKSLKEKSEAVKESEEQIAGYAQVMRGKRERENQDAWEVADMLVEHFDKDSIRRDWLSSIKRFNGKLGLIDVIDAMDIAIASGQHTETRVFKYFCGVCWNRVRSKENG